MKKNSIMAFVIGIMAIAISLVMVSMILWSLDQTILFVGEGTRVGVQNSSPVNFLGISVPSAVLLGILIQLLPTMFVLAADRITFIDARYARWIWIGAYWLFTCIDIFSNLAQIVTERLAGNPFNLFSGSFSQFLANSTWLVSGVIVTQFEELLLVMIGIATEHIALGIIGLTGTNSQFLASLVGSIKEAGRATSRAVTDVAHAATSMADSAFRR